VRGHGVGDVSAPVVLAALAIISWALRPASRTLGSLLPPGRARASGMPAGASGWPRPVSDSGRAGPPGRGREDDHDQADIDRDDVEPELT
jgi:hypothetical protein